MANPTLDEIEELVEQLTPLDQMRHTHRVLE